MDDNISALKVDGPDLGEFTEGDTPVGEEEPVASGEEEAPEDPTGDGEMTDPETADPEEVTPEADPEEGGEPEPSKELLEQIREVLPDVTPETLRDKLVQMRDRDKNVLSGMNKKFQEVAERRREVEQLRDKWSENMSVLESSRGQLAMRIAKDMENPTIEAALQQAYQSIQPSESDVATVQFNRQIEALNQKIERLEQDQQQTHQRSMDQHVVSIDEKIREAAGALETTPGDVYDIVRGITDEMKAAGHTVGAAEATRAVEMAKERFAERENRKFQAKLAEWKKSKQQTIDSAPPARKGGSVPSSRREKHAKPDINDPNWATKRMKELGMEFSDD